MACKIRSSTLFGGPAVDPTGKAPSWRPHRGIMFGLPPGNGADL